MKSGNVKTIVASLMMAGAALSLWFSYRETPPLPNPKLHEGIGMVMAEQAAKLLGSGGRITLLARDTSVFPNPATDMELKGFAEAVKKARLPVAATNVVKLDPLRMVRVPPRDFFEILRKQNDGDVIVSFVGPPLFTAAERTQFTARKAKVVALCAGELPRQVDLKEVFDQNLLHAAVINRPNPPSVTVQSEDPQAWFRQFFQLITPLNLSEMPLPSESRLR